MPPGPEEYKCPTCANPVGKLYALPEGIALLDVGGMLIRYSSGICKNCGEAIHWSVSEQKLTRLLRRMGRPDVELSAA
jgi:hypothetical protein